MIAPRIGLTLMLALPLLGGCKRSAPPTAPDAATPIRRVAAPAPAVTEAGVRGLVDRWLAAQNGGDLAGYERLYAPKFDGIKRAGNRTRGMDRATWMKDRGRMFAKPMQVSIAGLTVETMPGMARARFTQTFSVGNFRDTGPKELLLVAQGDRLLIAREEMLASQTGGAAPAAGPPGGGPLLVVAGGVLIHDAPAADWARGAPRLAVHDDDPDIMVATRDVDEARLPEALRGWQGRALHVLGDGPCTARIRALGLVVRVDPHFSTTQRWNGVDEEAEPGTPPGPPVSDEARAREVWEMAAPDLVGFLDQPCEGARWATVAKAAPAPAAMAALEEGGAPGAEAMRLLRVHPAFRKAQAEFEAGGETGPWPDSVTINGLTGSAGPLVVVSVSRSDGCAQFNGSLTYVFARDPSSNGPLRLVNDPVAIPGWTLEAAADFDGDGRWELLGNKNDATGDGLMLLGWRGARLALLASSAPTVLDCYC